MKKNRLPRNSLFLFVSLYFLLYTAVSFSAGQSGWQELKGGHFIIYFYKDEVLAKAVLDKAEVYYKKIADDLGYARYSKFWLWGDRVKIYICPNRITYLSITRQPGWSGGVADYKNKLIFTYREDERFLDSFLPHEIAHLILRDFIGFNPEIPLWLDEGVAQWEEIGKRVETEQKMKEIVAEKKFIPMHKFTKMDVRREKDADLVQVFYMEAASLVGFLVEKYGSSAFSELCRQLRDGKSLSDALRISTSAKIKNLDELEREWVGYVLK